MHTENETRDGGEDGKVSDGLEQEEKVISWRRMRACREDGVENDRRKVQIVEKTLPMEKVREVLERDGLCVRNDKVKEMRGGGLSLLLKGATIE